MKRVDIDHELLKVFRKNPEKYISGEELASHLGVTRTAIWNHISRLRDNGYVIDAQQNLGYCLKSVPDRMLPDEIKNVLKTRIIGKNIYAYSKTDSTSTVALRLAESGEDEGALVIAEEQSKGRGRLRRGWFSPEGKGLWFSLILRPQLSPAEASQVTLAASAACVRAIKDVCDLDAVIKWPNDVILGGKKVCGILTEMNSDMDQVRFLILGIGMNVNVERNELPKDLKDKATSIKLESNSRVSRIKLLSALLKRFEEYYIQLKRGEFEKVKSDWMTYSDMIGKYVKVETSGKTVEGYAIGVDYNGGLIIRLPNGLNEHVISGDVTVLK